MRLTSLLLVAILGMSGYAIGEALSEFTFPTISKGSGGKVEASSAVGYNGKAFSRHRKGSSGLGVSWNDLTSDLTDIGVNTAVSTIDVIAPAPSRVPNKLKSGTPFPESPGNASKPAISPAVSWTLVKTAAEATYKSVGDKLNYSLVLTNTGTIAISDVAVTDPGADAAPVRGTDSPGNNDNILEEGEVWNYTAVHTITAADVTAGSFTNNAKATGTQAGGPFPDATASVTICARPVLSGDTQLCKGETATLTSTGTPAISDPWVSASPAVASVNSSGFVTSFSAGSTVITFTTLQGCTETITVNVYDPPTITGPASVCRGAAVEYLGSGTPAATGAWTSSSPAIATIANTGLLTALASGSTTITYKDINGCTVSKALTVIASSTISGPTEVCKDATITLSGSGTPLSGSPWTSSDPDIATVDNKGVVTGIIAGTVTIIYINDLGCPATTTITVLPLPVISGDLGLCLGETSQLSADLSPAVSNAWVSSTPSVATVSAAGLVTSVAAGTTSITYTDNKGCSSTVTLTVFSLPVISGAAAVCAESTVQWSANVAPSVSTPWISSATAVATVSASGLITGVSAGTATITFTDINGCKSSKDVTVRALPVVSGDLDVCPGATSQLSGSGTPASSNAWSSSNPSVAGVSSTGLVTGATAGSVTITYTDANGCQRPVTFIVNPIPVITGTLSVCVGLTTTLETTSAPAAVLPWTSSATAVATVDKNGVVTGVSAGTTTITFTDANGCQGTTVVAVNANPVITGTTSVCEGLTTQLSGTGTPATTNPWISSNAAVATVSQAGLVTGVSAGTATITYTLQNGCLTTTTVTVNATPVITGTPEVCIGRTFQLSGSGTPAASNAWTSSVPSVATVSATGLVTGVAAGTTLVTYTNNNGCKATLTVTVNPLPTISGTLSVCVGLTTQLSGTSPAAATSPWTSSNTAVATVDGNGLVTAITAGSATITYTIEGGCQTTATVTVNAIPVITGSLSACVGATTQLVGSGTPATSNAWTTSDVNVATVNSTGLVTGIAAGTAVITYTNSSGCKNTASVTINENPLITGTLVVCAGEATQLTGSGTPAASNSWLSAATEVATVDATGLVTGVSGGSAIITYTDINGCQATATVTVNPEPVITGTLSVCLGLTTQLSANGTAAAANPWVTSDGGVATVDANGLVTGISAGTANITYTNSNGCKKTVAVTVNASPVITGVLSVCNGLTTQLTGSGAAATSNAWASATPAVATISSSGLVAGVSAGTALITYTDGNGCQATATITVNPLPTISGTLSVCTGLTTQLAGSGTAAETNPWTSADEAIATVDNNGLVTGVSEGTVSITYTDAAGCESVVSVTVSPNPVITGEDAVCTGSTIQLSGSGTPAAVNAWTSADNSIATISASGLVTGVAVGSVTITFISSAGCKTEKVISVNALPVISGTLDVCAAETTQLSGSGTPAASNAWSSSATGVATVDGTGLVTGVSAGTAVITYTNSNGCQNTATVTVNPLPVISGTRVVCEASTTKLSGNGTPAASDAWTSSDPSVATVDNTGLVSGLTGGTTTITYTNINGCKITATVIVNPLPQITGTLSSCIGTTTQLAASTAPAASNAWETSDLSVATVSTSGLVFGVDAGTATITYRDINGCSNTVTVTILALPSKPVLAVTQPDCISPLGSTQVLSPLGADIEYSLDGTTWTASTSYNNLVAGSYSLRARNADNCISTATDFVINAQPTTPGKATVTSSATGAVCSGTTVTLTSNVATGNQWYQNGTPINGANGSSFNTKQPGDYTVIVTTATGCVTDPSDKVTVVVDQAPTASIAQGATLAADCNNSPNTLNAVTNATSPTYQWYLDGNAIIGATGSSYVAIAAGKYKVEVIAGACSTLSTETTIVPASGTTASATNICAGESVPLTGAIPDGYVSPTFQWEVSTDGGSTFSNASGSSTAQVYLADATGFYRVVITDGAASTVSCAIQITVNALPVASISAAPSSSVCSGTTVNLSAIASGAGPLTYQWQQNGTDISGASGNTYAALTSGDYTVQVTSSDGCRITTTATTLTVNAVPALLISDPLPVCEPVTVDITKAAVTTGSTLPAGSVLSYWTNAAATAALVDPAAVAISGTYYIKAEVPSSGCSDIAPVEVAVNAAPVLVVTDPASVCTPATIDLTDAAVTAGSVLTNASLTYWRDSGAVNALTDPSAVSVTGTYFIQAESAGGCTSIKSVNLEIRQSPTLTGPAAVCVGSTVALSASGTPAAVNAWVTSDAAVATVSASGVVTGIAEGTVIITYTESNGCTATNSITVNALPTLTGNTEFCAGTTATLLGSGTPALNNAWVSSNPAVASVNTTGVVTGVAGGSATITYTNSSGCSKSLNLTVFAVPVISGVTTLCSGNTSTLSATTTPAAVTPWSSSDVTVATISDSGVLTAVAGGSATITFTNSNGCTATTVITINQTPAITGTNVVCAGATITLTGSGTPDTAAPWTSSDLTVAIVSSSGVVTGVGAGTATITYKVLNGCTTTVVVTVNPVPVITGSTTVCAAASISLTATGGTAAAGNPWTSSNPAIATVTSSGEVTGVAAGTSVITWTNTNGCASSLTVTVNAKPVITGTLSVCEGGTVSLTGSGTPAEVNAWTSSATGVATVDATGKVTAVSPGTSTITYTENSGCSVTAVVTINAKPVITGTPDLCSGSTLTLLSTGTPAITNPWISSDTQVATVSASGIVTGIAAGNAVITYTTAEGCSATFTVTVKAQPASPGLISGPAEVFEFTTQTYTIDQVPGVLTYNWNLPAGWTGTSSTNSITVVAGTEGGVITVSVTLDGCTSTAASLTVTMKPPMVLAEDDQLEPAVVDCDAEYNGGNIFGNDILNYEPVTAANQDQLVISIVSDGGMTGVSIDDNGDVIIPAGTKAGDYVIRYKLCEGIRAENCDEGEISVRVDEQPIEIPEAISPQGDGKNDKWIIRGIKCFPSASLSVFNRWGNLIYKAAPYNNDWDGRSDNSLTVSSGELVPAGTYFYVLDLGKGKRLTGSIYVAY